MTSINADCRQSFFLKGMIKPHGQGACFEHDTPRRRRPLANNVGDELGVGGAFPAPDAFASAPNGNRRIFLSIHPDQYILPRPFSVRCLGPACGREPVFRSYRRTATTLQYPHSLGRLAPAITPCGRPPTASMCQSGGVESHSREASM